MVLPCLACKGDLKDEDDKEEEEEADEEVLFCVPTPPSAHERDSISSCSAVDLTRQLALLFMLFTTSFS